MPAGCLNGDAEHASGYRYLEVSVGENSGHRLKLTESTYKGSDIYLKVIYIQNCSLIYVNIMIKFFCD